MKLYAIGDLHLSTTADKPMNVFGPAWEGHFEKIKKDWREKVSAEDVVLLAGDSSWAMKLEEAIPDLKEIAVLPGRKLIVRGNHDFWWSGISKVRQSAPDESFSFLQTEALRIEEGIVFVGSRGWTCPSSPEFSAQDEKLYLREVERFRLAFADAARLKKEGDKLVVVMHYPPFSAKCEDTLFTQLFEEHGVSAVVFGHIHGAAYFPLKHKKNGIDYYLTSCDKTAFALTRVQIC